jgi:hypothetical protein
LRAIDEMKFKNNEIENFLKERTNSLLKLELELELESKENGNGNGYGNGSSSGSGRRPDPEDCLVASDMLSNQIINLSAEDNSCEDILYQIDNAVSEVKCFILCYTVLYCAILCYALLSLVLLL